MSQGRALISPRLALTSLRSALEALLDAVYPPRCWVCDCAAPGGVACAEHGLPPEPRGPRCGRCARALPPALPPGTRCAACAREPPGFAGLVALADYRSQPAAREWVLALKHGGRRGLARPLGHALGRRLRAAPVEIARDALLVAVPLHPLRRLERGLDQAVLLARFAGQAAGLPVLAALARRRPTLPQGAPGCPSRRANVAGAFRVRRGVRSRLRRREVWLVDDVVTSGATVRECARVLRAAGARRVCVLCVARAGAGGTGDAGGFAGTAGAQGIVGSGDAGRGPAGVPGPAVGD